MEMSQIRNFLTLARTLNFTEAARQNGVTQPSLTKSIKHLEEELGSPLLIRDGKDTRLTALGQDVQLEFMRIDQTVKKIYERADQSISDRKTTINIGVSPTITAAPFTEFFAHVLRELPNVEINIHPSNPGDDESAVRSARFDAMITSTAPRDDNKISVLSLYHEPFVAAMATGHPLARKNEVTVDELAHEDYIDRLKCGFRTAIVEFFMDQNSLMQPRLSSEREDWVQQVIATSNAITIMPEHSVQHTGITTRPVAGLDLTRAIYLLVREGPTVPMELRHVKTLAEDYNWANVLEKSVNAQISKL